MADSGSKSSNRGPKKKKSKRKLSSPEINERPSKANRIDFAPEAEEPVKLEYSHVEGHPWRNLQLILFIQNKQLDLQKKVELALGFVKSRVKEGEVTDQEFETAKLSRLIVFLNDWIQSLLISSEKKIKFDGGKPLSEIIGTCLDFRCWEIFKFCLEESLKLHVPLSLSRNLLRAICCITRSTLSLLSDTSMSLKESLFVGEGFELCSIVLDCISLVFSSHSGLLNENLDLWIATADAVLELLRRIYEENLDGSNMGTFILQLSCCVLDPFAKFLRVHPARKNGFHDLVDKLLEPLLHLLGILHLRDDGSNSARTINLLKLVEDVICQGLFHPAHIDGFLSLHNTEKYVTSRDRKSNTVVKSYHRHLFDKLEKITAKKVLALSGIGCLFYLLVDRVKMQKGAPVLSEGTKEMGKTGGSGHLEDKFSGNLPKLFGGSGHLLPEKNCCTRNLNAETRKSLFEFFVQIMEPLLVEMNNHLQTKLEAGPVFLTVHSALKSINSLLAIFVHEKVYERTEDISEGACLNFLKTVYDMIMALSTKLLKFSEHDTNRRTHTEMFTLLAKEVIVAMGYFLEIEYEIIGNGLVGIWFMMLSFLAIAHSLVDDPVQRSLYSKTVDLGCLLVNFYSELRQVNNTIFALCKAVRLFISQDGDTEMNCSRFIPCSTSLSSEAYSKSVGTLLCSQEFKLAIHNAIKSIPEGQANGCIRELKVDVSESLEWMKISCSDSKQFGKQNVGSCLLGLDLQAELVGRGLSEVYALVLDSLTATVGNSTLIGVSVKDLMTVISPCMSSLVGQQPVSVNEFLFSAMGRSFDKVVIGQKSDFLKFGVSSQWIFVFFFRLYMSCRNLYRQAVSLMPPDTSRKMSARMGDAFVAYAGKDWMEMTDWIDEGYFSGIVQASVPLLVVIQSVSDIYLQEQVANCGPLIYVLLTMSIQRLVDLNRQINSLDYLLQSKVHTKLIDNVGLSVSCKKSKKWERKILILKQEAVGLTEFMMGFLLSVGNGQQSTTDDASFKNTEAQSLHESDKWDLGVCAVDECSLPTAIWWMLCQNTDIWCIHAAKKKLKLFLSLLISTSLLSVTSNFEEVGKLNITEPGPLKKVTVPQISLQLLGDSIFYEQRFVRRHMASRFCHVLEKSALTLFCDSCYEDVNFNSLPNWSEVLSALDKASNINELPTDICKKQKDLPLSSVKFTACQSLLTLLCWVPKGYICSRSLSLYATNILNLERLAVCALLDGQATLQSHSHSALIRLFLSCRKALKYLLVESCEDKVEANRLSFLSVFFENSSLILWLFKSVSMVVGLRQEYLEASSIDVKDMIFSLMDYTSYVFLTLSKYEFSHAVLPLIDNERPGDDQLNTSVANEQCNSIDFDSSMDTRRDVNAWKNVFLIAESLKEQTRNLYVSLKGSLCSDNERLGALVVDLSKLSSLASCFNGFLWGLSPSLNQIDAESSYDRANITIWKSERISKLNLCINVFVDFVNFFSHMLLSEDDNKLRNLYDAQTLPNLNDNNDVLGVQEFSLRGSGVETDTSGSTQKQKPVVTTIFSESSDIHDVPKNARISKRKSELYDANRVVSALTMGDSIEPQSINKPLLKSLLKGDNPEAAFLLRQLFIAASAILRLNFHINLNPSFSSLVPIFMDISQVLLLELAEMNEEPQPFSFVWLDGVLKYLEEFGSHFPLTNPTLSRNVYAKLVDLHLRAIGKCIALQGKRATLEAHQTESSTKMLHGRMGLSEASSSHRPYCLDEFISRLRMSFKVLIRKPVELHLLSAVQAIERALVGVHEGCSAIYEINKGSADGGMVSPIVAAGIDCLDLVLEFVSGRKRLSIVKRHIQSLIAGLFNIIMHLRSPVIFYGRLTHREGGNDPDTGSVILMCIEVLTRVSGKHALFQMESWHVTQSLRIPAALFQDFHQLRLFKDPVLSNFVMASDDQINDPVARENFRVDRQFAIDLYSACCRLLCTILKHHKSESERCIALLEDSVCALLRCLKTVNTDVRKENFAWEIQEGVKCACFLRRIYEEIRQQKNVFGLHSFKFLSSYIWVYSGYDPLKTGIRREIDEALRPGIYALIDACSADDLQYLHTVFGEGPCRNTLAALQHDYELNFQYEGKV